MLVCGWCEHPSARADLCSHCGHEDPARPWVQRGRTPPSVAEYEAAGRRHRIAEARRRLEASGHPVTNSALAEVLGVDARTVGRWLST